MTDEPGPLIASGRSADVYALGDDRVVRRSRDAGVDLGYEARVMRYVRERRYPVPEIHDVDGVDLVMERIDGPTMMEALEAAPWKVVWYARLLAKLQRRLARIPAPDWMLAPTADPRHPESVLHLDLHPMNVILSPRHGPTVIDWTNAAGGPAAFDATLTYVKIATYETTGRRDQLGQRVVAEAFKRFRRAEHFEAYLVAACDHWLSDTGILPAERVAVAELRRRATSARSDHRRP